MGAAGSIVIETETVNEAQAKALLGDAYDGAKYMAETCKYDDQVTDDFQPYLTKAQAEAYLKACADETAALEAAVEADLGAPGVGAELKLGMTVFFDGSTVRIKHVEISKAGKQEKIDIPPGPMDFGIDVSKPPNEQMNEFLLNAYYNGNLGPSTDFLKGLLRAAGTSP